MNVQRLTGRAEKTFIDRSNTRMNCYGVLVGTAFVITAYVMVAHASRPATANTFFIHASPTAAP